MKDVKEITACVVDYGTFESLAVKLAEDMECVYYYTPNEDEYRDIQKSMMGYGLEKVERVDEFMSPDVIKETDLFIFPDIGWGGVQKYLRSIGKKVWGSMGADELELYRTKFLALLKKLDLPMIKSIKVIGLTALSDHLKTTENKWIKIDRFRSNMETWHHTDWAHTERILEHLAVDLGGLKEIVTFIVQDDIETDIEVGYDGWCVNGEYPDEAYQGYEKKNILYLGARSEYADLPEEVRFVNEKMSETLEEYEYRNFWSTEIRVKDKTPYFIDPTPRMPGLTGEHLLETCSNLADIIWKGANSELIQPEFDYDFAVEATLCYTDNPDGWMTIRVPDEIKRWVKLYHYSQTGDTYQFPPDKTGEVGVMLGVGQTIEEAIEHLKDNLAQIKDEPLTSKVDKMTDLLKEAQEAKDKGMGFKGEIPSPEIVLEA